MGLETLWFCVIAFLWAGYFMLEGFDFGVGILLPFVGRDERDRSAMLETIAPVWDGNEVWLVVAGGATFAAFPAWYATMFSGFYLALLVVLVLLIVRVLSFEWRDRGDGRWRGLWLWANVAGSIGAPVIWGVALANLVQGVPIDSSGDYAGGLVDLFSPYTVAAGLVTVLLFALHGAMFLGLRTTGPLRERALDAARRLSAPAVVLAAGFLVWTVVVATDANHKSAFPAALVAGAAILAFAAGAAMVGKGRARPAFIASATGIVLTVATIFTSLYPRVMVSSSDFSNSLTTSNASSAHYTLAVMSVVAVFVTPVVLAYQAWTYYVLRRRLQGAAPAALPPTQPTS
jgi:cytochrome bd ubiquinol oxidase subunit II